MPLSLFGPEQPSGPHAILTHHELSLPKKQVYTSMLGPSMPRCIEGYVAACLVHDEAYRNTRFIFRLCLNRHLTAWSI